MTSPATEQPFKVVAVRLPPSLIDAAQRYADLYHSSVSTLLREGLELRLHPREGTSTPDGQPVLSPGTVAMLHQLARTLTTAAAEVRNVCQEPIEPQRYDGNTASREEACPPFDPVKYRLGKLCPSGHQWGTTGQSLRANNKGYYCLACNAALNKQAKQAKRGKRQQASVC